MLRTLTEWDACRVPATVGRFGSHAGGRRRSAERLAGARHVGRAVVRHEGRVAVGDRHPEQISPGDKLVLKNPDTLLKMDASLIDIGKKYFGSAVIDTSSLSPEAVIKEVFKHPKLKIV